jgi:hypothetical protein
MLNKIRSRNRKVFVVGLLVLLSLTIITGFAERKLNHQEADHSSGLQNLQKRTTTALVQPQQTSGQFDLSRNVIAGGGGSSTGGTLKIEGTIGQPAVGTTMSGGQFSLTGGFWQPLSGATPTPSPTPTPTPTPTPGAATIQFSAASYNGAEGNLKVVVTITRAGDLSGPADVRFATSDLAGAQNCNVLTGVASSRCDYETSISTIKFASGETSKALTLFIIDDSYLEGAETFSLTLSSPAGATLGLQSSANVIINDNDIANGANPIDNPSFFVLLHYLDFLNREPDTGGFNFWTNEISSCGGNAQCIELKRLNVSAAFYLSIEFQQTGYLVVRLYKAAYGSASGSSTLGGLHQLPVPIIRLNEFLPDTLEIGQNVVVGQTGWEQVLESNKQAFIASFVQRSRFTNALPGSLSPAQFVDALNVNAGSPLSTVERDQLVTALSSGAKTRAQVLREVAEDTDLVNGESNRAFVLMQFFGYLRRNPNDPQDTDYTGYDFWLTKLNQFNGNFVNAEMVKAFITSTEYRRRFGPE